VIRSDRRDSGASDVLSLVLIAPAMIALALVVIFLGRQVDAQAQVRSAAEAAAQAAALQRSPGQADAAARRTVAAMLVDTDTCLRPQVTVGLSRFVAGGSVSVEVACEVSTRGVVATGAPRRVFSATAVARLDAYRETVSR
jgi:Flp pilus assembly protein TadG